MSRKEYANFKLYPTKDACLPLQRAFRFPISPQEALTYFPSDPRGLAYFSRLLGSHLFLMPLALSHLTTSNTSLTSIGDILGMKMRPSIVPTYYFWIIGSYNSTSGQGYFRYSFLITRGLYTSIFIQQASGFTLWPSRSPTLLKEMSQLHNVYQKTLGIFLFINVPFFPSGLWSPEQQGEPGVALIIFRAFILNGVVPTLVPKWGQLNTNLLGWQSTRHPPTFVEQCSDCWTSYEDATDDMVTFDCCCSPLGGGVFF